MAKSKYEENFPDRVREMAEEGLTDNEMWLQLKISKVSFYNYQDKHPEFREAIVEGKRSPNKRVEKKLIDRCLGYDYEETHTSQKILGNGRTVTSVKKIKKHIPPDVLAIKFWLINRDKKRWNIKSDTELGDIKIQVEYV